MQLDLGAEAALHPLDDHLDVDLREPGDDLLAGLLVAMDVECRVLLGEAPDRGHGLLLVALGLGLEGERHHRRRQLELAEADLGALGREHVAGAGLAKLGHGSDVARPERVDGLVLLAAGRSELADPLLGTAGGVEHV